nr:MAG TPA: hypothetical protein [Bacteriophage sp.]
MSSVFYKFVKRTIYIDITRSLLARQSAPLRRTSEHADFMRYYIAPLITVY